MCLTNYYIIGHYRNARSCFKLDWNKSLHIGTVYTYFKFSKWSVIIMLFSVHVLLIPKFEASGFEPLSVLSPPRRQDRL